MVLGWRTAVHGAMFCSLPGESYFMVAAIFDIAAFSVISAFSKPCWFADCILSLCGISIFVNIFGFISWMNEVQLTSYVAENFAIYSMTAIIFLWMNDANDSAGDNDMHFIRLHSDPINSSLNSLY